MFSDRRYQEIAGASVILLSVIIFLSLFSYSATDITLLADGKGVGNMIGPLGAWFSNYLRTSFGFSSYILFFIFFASGWSVLRHGSLSHYLERIFALCYLLLTATALLALPGGASDPRQAGGYIGLYIQRFFESVAGRTGAYLLIILLNLAGLILLGIVSLSLLLEYAEKNSGRLAIFVKNAFNRLWLLRNRKKLPLNGIEETISKTGKIPWIVKKKIIVSSEKTAPPNSAPRLLELMDHDAPPEDYSPAMPVKNISGDNGAAGESVLEEEYCLVPAGKNLFDPDDAVLEGEVLAPERGEGFFAGRTMTGRIRSLEKDGTTGAASRDAKKGVTVTIAADEDEDDSDMDDDPVLVAPAGAPRGGALFPKEEGEFDDESYRRRIFEQIPINKEYIIPTNFLYPSSTADADSWKSEVKRNSELLVNTLRDFGIESRVVNVNRGPVITLYEMQIAPGIKVNRIVGLSDDIAMALAASRVRVVAPIPGKSAVGVEVPNRKREMVTLGDVIASPEYQSQPGKLKVALGKDILGKPIMLDLKKLPHLLIAGATGSGKSVCVNSIITSLIYNYDPNYVRFILVDPKMVELQLYNGLPHILTPVITEPHVVPKALKWTMYEMERRYRLLSELNTRDIDRYNEKIVGYEKSYERLPYIVVIMDELADLMMVAAKEIEGFITRIAQKARAVGIHLVLATQRPSVDIITGIIKANFPARIAFQVAQKTDSRTIIDQNGAEKLLGKGDMLYQSPMSSFPVRIQGAYISEDETMKIVQFLRKLGQPAYIDIEESVFDDEEQDETDEVEDELFVEALKIVEETKKASASYLQRRLSIGYNRAARIIELMEERGYVGQQQGSKPREVFV